MTGGVCQNRIEHSMMASEDTLHFALLQNPTSDFRYPFTRILIQVLVIGIQWGLQPSCTIYVCTQESLLLIIRYTPFSAPFKWVRELWPQSEWQPVLEEYNSPFFRRTANFEQISIALRYDSHHIPSLHQRNRSWIGCGNKESQKLYWKRKVPSTSVALPSLYTWTCLQVKDGELYQCHYNLVLSDLAYVCMYRRRGDSV